MTEENGNEPSFEQALQELESILRKLEDGSASLEDSLSRYERGIGLLKRCYRRLQEAEQRIVQISGLDADGKPVIQTFEHTATAETPKPRVARVKRPPEEN